MKFTAPAIGIAALGVLATVGLFALVFFPAGLLFYFAWNHGVAHIAPVGGIGFWTAAWAATFVRIIGSAFYKSGLSVKGGEN